VVKMTILVPVSTNASNIKLIRNYLLALRMLKKKCTSNFTGRRSSVDKKMFHDLLLRIKVISSVLGAFSTGNARWEIIVLCGVATGSLLYGPTFLF